MTSTLQIVDPNDASKVLFDLNDGSGANSSSYGNVRTALYDVIDWGVPTLDSNTVKPTDSDISYVTFARRATAEAKLKVRIQAATTVDNIATAVGTLAQYLAQGCVFKFIPLGSNTTYYVDVLPSPTPLIYDGTEMSLVQATMLYDTPQGIELTFTRQATFRSDALTAGTNAITNATMLRDSNADGTPDSWAVNGAATLAVDTASESVHVTTTGGTFRGIKQSGVAATVGTVYTGSAYVKVVSGQAELDITWTGAGTSSFGAAVTGNTWQRITVMGTAPGSTTSAAFVLSSGTATASEFYVKNAQFEAAATATAFRVGSETVSMDPPATGFARVLPVFNPATAPSPGVITLAFPDSSTAITDLDYWLESSDNILGNKFLADYMNGPFWGKAATNGNGWTVTDGTIGSTNGTPPSNTSTASSLLIDPGASPTDATTFKMAARYTRTTILDALRGKHRVFARVRAQNASVYRLQLQWGVGTTAVNTNDYFKHDTSDAVAFDYIMADLGEIEVPEETSVTLGQITLELWWRLGAGHATDRHKMDVDYILLVPSDQTAHVQVNTDDSGGTVLYSGNDLQTTAIQQLGSGEPVTWTAPATSTSDLILLSSNTEATGAGNNTNGAITGTGVFHITTFKVNIQTGAGASMTVTYGIGDLTDSNPNDAANNSTYISRAFSSRFAGKETFTVLWLDEVNDKYQPRIGITALTASGSVSVYSIKDITLSSVNQNQKVRTDPGSVPSRLGAEKLDSGGNVLGIMASHRVPFWFPPGLSLLVLDFGENPLNGYYDPLSIYNRTCTASVKLTPHYWT